MQPFLAYQTSNKTQSKKAYDPDGIPPWLLKEIMRDKARQLFVVPEWPTQSWYIMNIGTIISRPSTCSKSDTVPVQARAEARSTLNHK